MNSKFAISVPVGAYHPLLRDCLKSLAIQSPRPQVALLDASNDARVMAIADEFNAILSHRRHGPDAGQSDAIIEGWRNLDGDILGWLNADDALYPQATARVGERFQTTPSAGVVYGHSTIISDDGWFTGYHWAVEPPSNRLLAGDIISQPSCFFRRDAYEAIGGLDAALHYTMDWDLWVRFWRAGVEFSFIDDVLSRVLWTREAKTGGLGVSRRRELNRIIGQNTSASLMRRLKTRIGFGLNHVFEYMMPDTLARPIRQRLAPESTPINGLGRNGEIADVARLPLLHYDDAPRRCVEATFTHDATRVALTIEGCEVEVFVDGVVARIDLSTPLGAGDVARLVLSNDSAKPACLSNVTLC